MKQLDIKLVPCGKREVHLRFILRNNESETSDYIIIDEPMTKELCIQLYNRQAGLGIDEETVEYTISQRAKDKMLFILATDF